MRICLGFCGGVLAGALLACDDDGGGAADAAPPALFPADFATTYTEVRDCRFSIEHDSVVMRVWASPEAVDAYQGGLYPLPEGATLVKQEHVLDGCEDLAGYTVMKKGPPGTAPEAGDWLWQKVDALGRVEAIDERRCVSCHTGCTGGRDFTCTNP